jgi:hypothetical protein
MSGAIAIIALLKIVVTSYNIGVIAKNRIGKILKIISQIYMYLHKSESNLVLFINTRGGILY